MAALFASDWDWIVARETREYLQSYNTAQRRKIGRALGTYPYPEPYDGDTRSASPFRANPTVTPGLGAIRSETSPVVIRHLRKTRHRRTVLPINRISRRTAAVTFDTHHHPTRETETERTHSRTVQSCKLQGLLRKPLQCALHVPPSVSSSAANGEPRNSSDNCGVLEKRRNSSGSRSSSPPPPAERRRANYFLGTPRYVL